jgi:methylmalonyl-CoA/ethylmalonyl-CoA epimerase
MTTFLKKLDHIGIAVHNIKESLQFYEQILGLKAGAPEEVTQQGVRLIMLPLRDINIELLEPLSENSAIYKFLQKRGEGIHHLCFEVDNLEHKLKKLSAHGIKLIDQQPRKGYGGSLIAFLHPSSTQGILIELKQSSKD